MCANLALSDAICYAARFSAALTVAHRYRSGRDRVADAGCDIFRKDSA
jgi:hypothetical protein